jgi:hypothetical protein
MLLSNEHTVKKGVANTHHILTHEEPNNAEGYQAEHSWFIRRAMVAWAQFVGALAAVPEGAGTLLDNTLVYAHSDITNARLHTIENPPMMTAGRAGGRIRTGLHLSGKNQTLATAVGLTALHAMGLEVAGWGVKGMRVATPISEILV